MDIGLTGVHVLITGASGGIGLETAKSFLGLIGCYVTAHYNSNLAPLQPLIDQYGADRITALKADLTVEKDVIHLFSAIPTVQVAVINHGIWPTEDVPVASMSLAQWERTIACNLTSSFLVAREYLKKLSIAPENIKDKASIVLIGSSSGRFGEAGHADYSASKSALMYGFTLSLKNEIVKIAKHGRVNCIAPGWVKTPMAEQALQNPDVVYAALATTPLKRVAEPIDVANQVLVIASPILSRHVTGEVIMVTGGLEGRLLNKPHDIPA
ncbi:NAD(P)-binding protein [Sistotremastrum niveocremeum HHB9708]|uniref:NAD(P)-binding protein n=1 Tax=Sistotremastrum niveocremeum HHB9708 TaxID=1314777 RepID=A0A164Q6M0_9AGAM|nr:NAD(P)-binding protein [Sistotremastrum niveocremeum HHB9708]